MNIIKPLIYIISCVLIFSCTQQSNTNLFSKELSLSSSFPIIIDPLTKQATKLTSRTSLDVGSYLTFYLGKAKDSLVITRSTKPIYTPIVDGVTKSNYLYKKDQFNAYFTKYKSSKHFIAGDSVNIAIQIDTNQLIYQEGHKAYPVILQNNAEDTIQIGLGSYISMITEAQTKRGVWKAIEKEEWHSCGVGIQKTILPPKQIALTTSTVSIGTYKTKLRLRLGNNYSEAFTGYINQSQFKE